MYLLAKVQLLVQIVLLRNLYLHILYVLVILQE